MRTSPRLAGDRTIISTPKPGICQGPISTDARANSGQAVPVKPEAPPVLARAVRSGLGPGSYHEPVISDGPRPPSDEPTSPDGPARPPYDWAAAGPADPGPESERPRPRVGPFVRLARVHAAATATDAVVAAALLSYTHDADLVVSSREVVST